MRRSVLVLAGGAALSCLVVAGTTSTVLAHAMPRIVLSIWPASAEAASRQAELLSTEGTSADVTRARPLAEQALRRQPVDVVAARTLAIIAARQGNAVRVEKMLTLAQWLSRRDPPTQILLIETHVQAGDVAGALAHYDHAMQTSVATRETLLPVLTAAADDPVIARPVAALLARRPWWWQDFFDGYARTSRNPASFATITGALHLHPGRPEEIERLGIAINHLVGLGDIGRAARLYAAVRPSASSSLVHDGGFEDSVTLPPFEWTYVADEERAGIREYREGASGKAALSFTGTATGTVARQLLVLPAGRYVLTARIGQVGAEGGSAPSITLACIGTGTVLKTAPMPAARTATTWRVLFDVTARQCPAQWLSLNAGGNIDTAGVSPWIDDIRIDGQF